MDGGTLPGTEAAPDNRIVAHVDMDCFYASCERRRDPSLRGEPLVVGMGYESAATHGAVATASYEAREAGVESAQPISEALELLPRMEDVDTSDPETPDSLDTGYYRPVDMELYKSVATEVKAVLHDCAETVREVSIDEAYLDLTERTAWDRLDEASRATGPGQRRSIAEGFARHVKQRIRREAGVPASVGVAPDMSTAKIASDYDKPDGLVMIPPGRVQEFLDPLPVETIHGIGPVTARELDECGIATVRELASADVATLETRFGERGPQLRSRARGEDTREVTPAGLPKSLSRESAFAGSTVDQTAKRQKIRALAADVADRARSRGALYRTIGIKAVAPPFDVNTRAESLSGPVDDPDLLEQVALGLLEEFETAEIRKLGVRVSNLDFAGDDQATLEGFDSADLTATGGDGERLTDWVGREPTATDAEKTEPDGQSSLAEFTPSE